MKLQNILLLRELGFSLKEIKKILSNTDKGEDFFDKQKEILILKRNRINELIELLEKIKRGEKTMSFKEFSTEQTDQSFQEMLEIFSDEERQKYLDDMGGEVKARESYEKTLLENQANLDRYIVDDEDIKNMQNLSVPQNAEENLKNSQEKIDQLNSQLSKLMDKGYESKTVQEIVHELETEHKKLFNMNNVRAMFADLGKLYLENKQASTSFDTLYGKGFANFYGNAVLFYCNNN